VDGVLEELGGQGILLDGLERDSMVRGEDLRTVPGMHGCDGFYAVVLERS
jgi:16S rRNA (cytosine967-C5)-methyltransferase